MLRRDDERRQPRRVLLIPGGSWTVDGYFPDLASAIATHATVLEFDPPGIGKTSDASQLRLSDYAAAMANRNRQGGPDWGHSSGTALEDWWRSGWRSARSPIRRAHERLVASIPDAGLAVSEGTSHPLQIQQLAKVAEVTLALLERA